MMAAYLAIREAMGMEMMIANKMAPWPLQGINAIVIVIIQLLTFLGYSLNTGEVKHTYMSR